MPPALEGVSGDRDSTLGLTRKQSSNRDFQTSLVGTCNSSDEPVIGPAIPAAPCLSLRCP